MGGMKKVKAADATEFGGPKKPANAYFAFGNNVRPKILEELRAKAAASGESLKIAEVGKAIAEQWKAISAGDKKKLEETAATEKAAYDAAMTAWKLTDGYKQYLGASGEVTKQKAAVRAKKAIKDATPANMPKRPAAAYFQFSIDMGEEVKKELEAAGKPFNFGTKAAAIKEKWAALSQEDKDKLEEQYKAKREEYEQALKAFQETDEYKEFEQAKKKAKKSEAASKKLADKKSAGPQADEETAPAESEEPTPSDE